MIENTIALIDEHTELLVTQRFAASPAIYRRRTARGEQMLMAPQALDAFNAAAVREESARPELEQRAAEYVAEFAALVERNAAIERAARAERERLAARTPEQVTAEEAAAAYRRSPTPEADWDAYHFSYVPPAPPPPGGYRTRR